MGSSTVWYTRSWTLDSDGLTQRAAYYLWDVGKLLHLSANHLPPDNEAKPIELSVGLCEQIYIKHLV